jgi:hypothetical protein
MTKIKKINYYLLFASCGLLIALLFITPAQSQTSETGITLTWSTDTYIPLDYPGKALPSRGSNVEVVATIDSNQINPQKLIFNWFLSGLIQKEASGQGKQVFRFNIGESIAKRRLVKLEIRNNQGDILGVSNYLSLRAYKPEITLKTRAFVLELKPLTYVVSANQSVTFTVQPYFFNIKGIDDLIYEWDLGGRIASQISENNPNVFTLQIGELVKSITQNLRVWVENKNNPIQRSQAIAEIILTP